MKIVVIGGTGLIGQKLVQILSKQNHEVLAASPSTGVDTVTKKGLDRALENATIVVDVSNAPSLENQAVLEFFIASNKNLLVAEKKAGVHHHIALSVVGIQNLGQSGYFRGQIAQEELIKSANIPYTLIYSTQFFESIDQILKTFTMGSRIIMPPSLVQPIAAMDVAGFMADAILMSEVNSAFEIAGPQRFSMEQWAKRYQEAQSLDRPLLTDSKTPFFGAQVGADTLLPSNGAKRGETTFGQWLDGTLNEHG